jgi:DNA repair photolyase
MTAPIIPGLNSYEIPKLIEEAAKRGALSAGYTIVRLNGAIGLIFTDWIHKTFPDRAEKVLGLIKSCHGSKLSDSRFGTRMRGEGKVAEAIRQMHAIAKNKFMPGREMPEYDTTIFQKPGQLRLL